MTVVTDLLLTAQMFRLIFVDNFVCSDVVEWRVVEINWNLIVHYQEWSLGLNLVSLNKQGVKNTWEMQFPRTFQDIILTIQEHMQPHSMV